jgi:hypothetical protein
MIRHRVAFFCYDLGCIFLPKGMNKGGLNPELPPETPGAGWQAAFFYALLVAFS